MTLSPDRQQRVQSILQQLGRFPPPPLDSINAVPIDAMPPSPAAAPMPIAAALHHENGMGTVIAAPLPPLPCDGHDCDEFERKLYLDDERSVGGGSHNNSSNTSNAMGYSERIKPTAYMRAPRSDKQSRTNLFISNIPHKMEHSDLVRMFSPYGEIVSAAVMRNIHTGNSLGTAFVRYATPEQAEKAINGMGGQKLNGRTVIVQWAKKQHDDAPVGEARKKICKLFVRNIPLDIGVSDLILLFSQYGPVKNVSIHKDTAPDIERNLERHIAFITYLADGAAEKAADAIHNTRPFPSCGKIPLMVKLAEDTPQYAHHNNANSSLNSTMKSGRSLPPFQETSSPEPVRVSSNTVVRGVLPIGSERATAPPAAVPTFYPTVMPTTGFIPPPAYPSVGMGNDQGYPVSAQLVWPQPAGIPVAVQGGYSASTPVTDNAALGNTIIAPIYQPQFQTVGVTGLAALPIYTTQFYPVLSGFPEQQSDAAVRAAAGAEVVTLMPPAPKGHTALLPEYAALVTAPAPQPRPVAEAVPYTREKKMPMPLLGDDPIGVKGCRSALPALLDDEELSLMRAMARLSVAVPVMDERRHVV
ncbi:RNA-binding protein [Trypanosoma grayi]|uniref:RNA-binding protein n=1 Tax=Trypanosoma grayi TaxID=71804 RepID=UPI0004F48B88|nr:RNA-binding protein [Trypanosoma grayi]KEG12022.1 RNA-binding protein [Trypanosoma grayi]